MSPEEYYKKITKEDKDSIIELNEKSFDFIPTGSWVLNYLIGDGTNQGKPGGLPRAHYVEVFGDESSGKTTMALSACKQVQLAGGLPVFVDYERSFHETYARNLGLNLDKNSFILIEPKNLEHGAKMMADTLLMKPWLIVVDSVSAMVPKAYFEGSVDEAGKIGEQARQLSRILPFFLPHIKKSNTCVLFTNQLRSVIKRNNYQHGPDEETSGGKALKYYSHVRIRFRKSTVDKINARNIVTGKTDKDPVNLVVKASIVKNKVDRPFLSGPIYIRFGEGFDNIMSMIELGINTNVIKKRGTYYVFTHNKEDVFNVQGKEQLRNLLTNNDSIYNLLTSSLTFKEDKQARQEAMEEEKVGEKETLSDELEEMLEGPKEDEDKKKSK